MKRFLSSLLAVSLIAALVIIQTGCEVEVEGDVSGGGSASGGFDSSGNLSGNVKGEVKVGFRITIKFSPKPTVFDEVLILDFNKALNVIDNNFLVTVSVNTDTRFTKNATFMFSRDTKLRIAPVLKNANSHVFTPANKAALDKFIKQVLENTNHLTTVNFSFKFNYEGPFQVKANEPLRLTGNDIGLRMRFLPNQKPTPVNIKNVNVPIKLLQAK